MDNRTRKALLKAGAQVTRKFDQELREVRSLYDGLSADERPQFRKWLEKLSALSKPKPLSLRVWLRVCTEDICWDANGEAVYRGSACLDPEVLAAAVDAWEKGEEYAPSWLRCV